MADDVTGLLVQYYRNTCVHKRMREFLGGPSLQRATAAYIVAGDGYSDFGQPAPTTSLPSYLAKGLEIERSLWDKQSLLVDLDLDYENFDRAEAPYLDPSRIFALGEPLAKATIQILATLGIQPLELVSGRGHHLVWRIRQHSRAFRRLAQLGQLPFSLRSQYAAQRSPGGDRLSSELGHAFAGLGMVLEYVAHRALAAAAPLSSVPVQIASIEAGPGTQGREILSFDLTEYGDPLHVRHMRIPFSAYLKPRKLLWALGEIGVRQLLPLFEIPLTGLKLPEAIAIMRQPSEVLRLAKQANTRIPDESDAMLCLINDYEHSDLADFHKMFYAMSEHDAGLSAMQLEATLVETVPLCTRWVLDHPNDWLLKPAILQHVVRVLTAVNWHPRSIAELIRARYESDHGWGNFWGQHDRSWRATFYTRLFTGLIATGLDGLVDLNCVSQKEKGQCMIPECSHNLAVYRDLIRARRPHERLGSRIVDRLLLADKHL